MKILRMTEVKIETGHRSHASIYTAVKNGLFTKPISIGARAVGWPESEVQSINHARIAGFSEGEIKQLVETLHKKRLNASDVSENPVIKTPHQPTPGGWFAVGAWIEHEDDDVPDIANFDPASIEQGGRSYEEICANARLCAAAPEMLLALAEFLSSGDTKTARKKAISACRSAVWGEA
jgi:prophage regulatory protein